MVLFNVLVDNTYTKNTDKYPSTTLFKLRFAHVLGARNLNWAKQICANSLFEQIRFILKSWNSSLVI